MCPNDELPIATPPHHPPRSLRRSTSAARLVAPVVAALLVACSSVESPPTAGAPGPADGGANDAPAPSPAPEEDLDFAKVILEGAGLPAKVDPGQPLTTAGAVEDVRFLEFFVEYGYAARAWREAQGVDFRKTFSALRERVRAKSDWTVGSFYDELRATLAAVMEDSHMAIFVAGASSSRWGASLGDHWEASYLAAGAPRDFDPTTCASGEVRALPSQPFVTASGNATRHVFLTRAATTSIACGGAAAAVTPIPTSTRTLPTKLTEREIDSSTYYVRLPSFAAGDLAQAEAFADTATRARTHAKVVLDLRGNPGGDPSFFIPWLEALGVYGTISVPPLVHLDSFAASVLTNNGFEQSLHTAGLTAEWKKELERRLARTKKSIQKDLAEKNVRRREPLADLPHTSYALAASGAAFAGEVRILVDSRCASACEYAAEIGKQLPQFFVLSDTNTQGAILSGDPAPLPLPSSSIIVYMGTGMVSRPLDWGAREGQGVVPDVWMDPAAMSALFP